MRGQISISKQEMVSKINRKDLGSSQVKMDKYNKERHWKICVNSAENNVTNYYNVYIKLLIYIYMLP